MLMIMNLVDAFKTWLIELFFKNGKIWCLHFLEIYDVWLEPVKLKE